MSHPPSNLGPYEIIREIARSNDIVYEAYDSVMNRRLAIKELAIAPGLTEEQRNDRVQRFKREAQAVGSLNHPNIMTVHSFAEEDGRLFIAMEYLDGESLRRQLDRTFVLSPDRAVEIILEVLNGLEHAHSRGVIHRDIKPDNLQILSDGHVKITDFGIARVRTQPDLTSNGQVFGTPSYMSPEQILGKEVDERSDLFSLGIVLYEAISGQKPFTGDHVIAISYAIVHTEPLVPVQCPVWLEPVFRKMLDKNPDARFQLTSEFRAALSAPLVDDKLALPTVAAPLALPKLTYDPFADPTRGGIGPSGFGNAPFDPGPPIRPMAPNQYDNETYAKSVALAAVIIGPLVALVIFGLYVLSRYVH